MWQMNNYFLDRAQAEGRRLIRINLDETSIPLFPLPRSGVIMATRRGQDAGVLTVRRGDKRKNITYVAMLADDPQVQATLPQVIIGGPTTFLVRDMERLWGDTPYFVYLIRSLKTAWNSFDSMRQILRLLAQVRRDFWPETYFLLSYRHLVECRY